MQTVYISKFLPPAEDGWEGRDPDTSGQWAGVTKFSRRMTKLEVATAWAAVGTVSVATLGVFAAYIACSEEQFFQLQCLRNRECVWYVYPSMPAYLSLPRDVRMHIETFLPFQDWMQLRKVSPVTKRTVDHALLVQDKRLKETVQNIMLKSYDILELSSAPHFTCQPNTFARVLSAYHTLLKVPYFKDYDLDIEHLTPRIRGEYLDALIPRMKASTLSRATDIFFQYVFEDAAPHTILLLLQKIDDAIISVSIAPQARMLLNQKTCKIFEEKREKLLALSQQMGESQGVWQEVLVSLLDQSPVHIYRLLPTMTYREFIAHLNTLYGKYRSPRLVQDNACFAARKCIDICSKEESQTLMLYKFKQLYEDAKSDSLSLHKDKWKNWMDTFTYELFMSCNLGKDVSQRLAKNILYCIYACRDPSIGDAFFDQVIQSHWRYLEQRNPFFTYFLESWAHWCHISHFCTPFSKIFQIRPSCTSIKVLVDSVSRLSEPRKSLYLRAIAHNEWFSKLYFREQYFDTHLAPILTLGPVTENELIIRLSSCSGFFEEVATLSSRTGLERLIDQTLSLKVTSQRDARLAFLAHSWDGVKGVEYALPMETRRAAFTEKNLSMHRYGPITVEKFIEIEKAIFANESA